MGKKTVLRVKRRRHDPAPPATFTLQTAAVASLSLGDNKDGTARKKQKSDDTDDAMLLTNLMHQSTFLTKRSEQFPPPPPPPTPQTEQVKVADKKIVFRRANGVETRNPNKTNGTIAGTSSNDTASTSYSKQVKPQSRKNKRKVDVIHVVDARLDSISSISTSPLGRNEEEVNSHQSQDLDNKTLGNGQDDDIDCEQQRQRKRTKLSLQMVECRTMTEREFRTIQQVGEDTSSQIKENKKPDSNKKDGNIKGKSRNGALRARMKRNALKSSSSSSSTATTTTASSSTKTDNSSSGERRNGFRPSNIRVLDPLSKMIDDSLCNLTATLTNSFTTATIPSSTVANTTSNATAVSSDPNSNYNNILSHIQLIQNHALVSMSKYLNWTCCNDGIGGTVLHATAHLNCVHGARYLCDTFLDTLDLQIKDKDGHTALDIANMVGTTAVADVLRTARGGICADNGSRRDNIEEREEDFVYDLYYLDCGDETNDSTESGRGRDECQGEERCSAQDDEKKISANDENASPKTNISNGHSHPTSNGNIHANMGGQQGDSIEAKPSHSSETSRPTIEMHGGVGYWNEFGELVLEADSKLGGQAEYDSGMDNDGDEDSNCEDYEGNDYPEDEDEDEDGLVGRAHHYVRSESYDHGEYPDPQFGGGAFMTAAMSGAQQPGENVNLVDSDDDDVDPYEIDFRNRPVDLGNTSSHGFEGYYGHAMHANNDFDDDNDYVEYGDSNQEWSNDRAHAETSYAYDPYLDDEE